MHLSFGYFLALVLVGDFGCVSVSAVRRGDWKLLETRRPPNPRLQVSPTPRGVRLFQLPTDPGEDRDRPGLAPARTASLYAALRQWQAELPDEIQKRIHE